MITKEMLKDYAAKLMFDMKDEEYETLEKEFKTFTKQMDLIGKVEGIENVEPMTFPFVTYDATFRDDIVENELDTKEVLMNAKDVTSDQVKVPKVVE